MAWARITDDFIDHPKVAELTADVEGLAALGLWTSALVWVRADRRRRGVVPTGIAIRYSAGAGKQLASRLVAVGLWDEVDNGYVFHDYEDIYTPGDLSEKRAAAGRSGGRASGRTRAAKAADQQAPPSSKQLASGKSGTKRAVEHQSSVSLFDDNDPLTAGSSTSIDRSNREANTKQVASKREAKRDEASHARAGATTHYPEASNEASTSLPSAKATDEKETTEQRVNRVARTYADKVKLTNFVALRGIVRTALKEYDEQAVVEALADMADQRATVTANSLRHLIERTPTWPTNGRRSGRSDQQPRRGMVRDTHAKRDEYLADI